MNQITVFYDGACPLCVREIALLKKLDKARNRIKFADVSPPEAAEFCPIPQKQLLARFHVQTHDGKLVDGAEAFTLAYAQLPFLGWSRHLGQFPPSRALLNVIYAGFLKIRPYAQKMAIKVTR